MSFQAKITEPEKNIEDFNRLYQELVSLLQQQIKYIQQGNIEGMEKIAEQCAGYVEKIGLMKLLDKEQFEAQRLQLRDLYGKLCLLITDQKQKTTEEIRKIRKTSKTLDIYRSSV
ncbi:MAG: hypothetical protein JW804_06570 [Sedimentisphaerales bacterium]|nr:hypothetical protein [Sedimentisphaerales bacterium]